MDSRIRGAVFVIARSDSDEAIQHSPAARFFLSPHAGRGEEKHSRSRAALLLAPRVLNTPPAKTRRRKSGLRQSDPGVEGRIGQGRDGAFPFRVRPRGRRFAPPTLQTNETKKGSRTPKGAGSP